MHQWIVISLVLDLKTIIQSLIIGLLKVNLTLVDSKINYNLKHYIQYKNQSKNSQSHNFNS